MILYFAILKWFIRIGILFWVLLMVGLPIYGKIFSNSEHINILSSHMIKNAFLIGMGGSTVTCVNGECDHSNDYKQRSYLTFPSSFTTGKIISVNIYHNERVEILQEKYIAYVLFLLWIAGVWYSHKWLKKYNKAFNSPSAGTAKNAAP